MRIIHISLLYPPASDTTAVHVRNIVEKTRDINTGRDVRVLTSRLYSLKPLTLIDPELLLDDPPYVQRLHHLKLPFFFEPRLQALTYYLQHHRPDIIHTHGSHAAAHTATRFARRHKIPLVSHP